MKNAPASPPRTLPPPRTSSPAVSHPSASPLISVAERNLPPVSSAAECRRRRGAAFAPSTPSGVAHPRRCRWTF
ncbi:hypothetical protein AB3S75_019671 [Citrus x aurantiifolia]